MAPGNGGGVDVLAGETHSIAHGRRADCVSVAANATMSTGRCRPLILAAPMAAPMATHCRAGLRRSLSLGAGLARDIDAVQR